MFSFVLPRYLRGTAKLTENALAAKCMKLNSLKLQNFKNYSDFDIHFGSAINCILGKNGMGKTNLLDAIHYLSMTRSALNSLDQQNISHGQPFFAINGQLETLAGSEKLICYYERAKKKIFKVSGKELEKLSDHIGQVPSVLITPDDTEIIREGSEVRRKFVDSVISQQDRGYLELLIAMQRLLKQRNSFLKSNEGKQRINLQLLSVYDEGLLPLFAKIGKVRQAFIEDFSPFFEENYRLIFDGEESPKITFKSEVLEEDFEKAYKASIQKDVILQRTSKGPHRDDYEFRLNDRAIKKYGSQGQQKSFVIALKLAEYDFLKSRKHFNPFLLLDDIFDKLDDERIGRLVSLLTDKDRFSQIFITDAREERSRAIFGQIPDVSYFEIVKGILK
ncbi:MAG: DNA replication and repair protein RecF [Marinoscillum sp.]|jgi:DNA replication and repair protein RecF